ncbi:helix-turn-helix domain-containing protein [Deminuibacter soli]|nr:helix-turn-helix transcriptional regulator [Deminuibacter soli]
MNEIKTARAQLGAFFRQRREEMGIPIEVLGDFLGVTANTINGIETGRFAWDIDIHLRLCQAMEIKPYFSTTKPPGSEDYRNRPDDDAERYHGYYISENLMLYPNQLAILKLTSPRLFLRFNYPDSHFIDFDDWKANHTDLQWLDPTDKPGSQEEAESILIDCWNFLALHEREEDKLYSDEENQ